jgi:LPS O-antigen subunit length determinant protein (WzzB/FepE family)
MGTQIDYPSNFDNYGDDKHYCWNHKKMIIRDYKNKKAEKIKEEKKNLKLKEKEELQKAKDEAKQKAKEEKEKAKEELKKSVQLAKQNKKTKPKVINNDNTIVIDLTNENVVIDLTNENVVINSLCKEILKTGENKGSQCGNKAFENNLCKRHTKKQLTTNI